MQIISLKKNGKEISLAAGCGLCLGHFDGVHMGHQALVEALKKMNADIWNICNNHIMDAGPYRIESTLKIAKENNVLFAILKQEINS